MPEFMYIVTWQWEALCIFTILIISQIESLTFTLRLF